MYFPDLFLAAILAFAISGHALKLHIVNSIVVNITLTNIVAGTASVQFVAQNPVDFPITVSHISISAGTNNTEYAHFSTPITLNLPASGTTRSPIVSTVALDKGALGSILLLFAPTIDIYSANLSLSAYKIPIELDNIVQLAAPLKVNLNIFSLNKRDQLMARDLYAEYEHIEVMA